MKKMIMSLAAVAMLSTSVFGFEGKIVDLFIEGDTGKLKFKIEHSTGTTVALPIVALNADTRKAMIAMVLTAKAQNTNIDARTKIINGHKGWGLIIIP